MSLESIKENKLPVLFLLVIGVCFYMMNVFTPLFVDDYHYCFIFGTTTPINSLGDIFVSQYRHYFEFNGRVVTHVMVQLFDGLLGKAAFNVANAIVFVLFLHLLATTITQDKKQYYKALTFELIFIFLVMPAFLDIFLWLSGAFNYLWTATILLVFHQQLQRDRKPSKLLLPLWVIAGILCGWTNEALVFGMVAGYAVHYACNRKELTPYRIALLAGFVIGAALLISPGSLSRATGDGTSGAFSVIETIKSCALALLAMDNLRIFFVLLAALVVAGICSKKLFKATIRENTLWLTDIAIAFVFIVMTRHESYHSRFGIELFSLIVLVRLLLHIKVPNVVCTVCNVAVCVFVAFAVSACKASCEEHKLLDEQLQDKSKFIIIGHDINKPAVFNPSLTL